MAAIVLAIVFISGFTGLIYQVTWQKYLSIYLGSHALSTSLTLSCFFLFLALGYQALGRYGHKFGENRILTYAYLEGLIGVYAILSPSLFLSLYEIWPSYPSHSLPHFVGSGFFALVLIGFPTFLMGGTIPLLTQGMSRELEDGHKVHAWVYGLNTLGAFIGTMIAGFYLVETLGLAQTLNITGVLNCVVCVLLIFYCRFSIRDFRGFEPKQSRVKTKFNITLLTLAFLSGFISFGLENLIIRMAGLTVGSSNYTYTVIVGAFILSIALGSLFSARISEKKGLWWLLFSQIGLFTFLCLLTLMIPHWPDILARVRLIFATSEINFLPYWMGVFLVFQFMVIIPVFFLGMTLPLLFQQLKREGHFLNQTAGRMYALNSIGATLGSILLGYLVFYFLDARQVLLVIIFLSALSIAIVQRIQKQKKILSGVPVVLALFVAALLPQWKDKDFVPGKFSRNIRVPKTMEEYHLKKRKEKESIEEGLKVLFSDFGVNTYTVVTENINGNRTLYVNGKVDADTGGDKFTRSMTALIPLTLSQSNEDIFIIGLGSGMSTGMAAQFPGTRSIKVSEIALGVIRALPFFEKWNFNLSDNDEKVEIVNDDAYKVLKSEDKKYDLIFSEPSNTWVTGVEKIYTFEFLKQASSKLKKNGLYSQWFPLFAMSEEGFLSILNNFKQAFNHVTLWSAGGGATIIVASNDTLRVNLERIRQKAKEAQNIYSSVQRENGVDLLYHQLLTDPAVTDLAKRASLVHSLFHPTLAYQSGRAYFRNSMIIHEQLANKYFVKFAEDDSDENSPGFKGSVQARGSDQLLWKRVIGELPESFFESGVKFLLDVDPIYAGRLSLARSQEMSKNREDTSKENVSEKLKQYEYLLSQNPKTIPEATNDNVPISNELFSRYLYLLAMREKPFLENVLRAVPEDCKKDDHSCLQNKIQISIFLNPMIERIQSKLLRDLATETEEAKNRIEATFRSEIQKLN